MIYLRVSFRCQIDSQLLFQSKNTYFYANYSTIRTRTFHLYLSYTLASLLVLNNKITLIQTLFVF
jgi:hypothetical protein